MPKQSGHVYVAIRDETGALKYHSRYTTADVDGETAKHQKLQDGRADQSEAPPAAQRKRARKGAAATSATDIAPAEDASAVDPLYAPIGAHGEKGAPDVGAAAAPAPKAKRARKSTAKRRR